MIFILINFKTSYEECKVSPANKGYREGGRTSRDATEEIRVLVRTDSHFGASSVAKLKLALGCRGKAANPSYATCAQPGGPAANAQSIPRVLLDIDEVTGLSLQPCLLVLDS